ncbi:hypothetical protein KIN20_037145 [Parelaphostrongylus tenuis]|uniref:Uncharacterized protein n=1 Tax=Parelaphostrongylus tenuis TaxID=148309 RepID=A0AAD5REB2_PARTN|nr:hypothetical protein KIN20_037145 [Parelaphostrongylus tenuis]
MNGEHHLRNASLNDSHVMESFDVTALHTNVSSESAMQDICDLLTELERTTKMYGFSIRQVMALLKVPKLLIL